MQLSDAFRRWLAQHGSTFLQPILAAVDGQPAHVVRGSAGYQQQVIAEAISAAPLQLRLIDPTYGQLTTFLLDSRESFFDARQSTVRLRPEWTDVLAQFSAAAPALQSPPAEDAADQLAKLADEEDGEAGRAGSAGGTSSAPAAAAAPAAPLRVDIPVGIDLGTTYSVVAHLDAHGRPTSIPNANGDLLTPSVVLFDDDGVVVGKEAVMAAALEPDRVADCVKRDMGSKRYRKPIRGEFLPPEVISSIILRRLKEDAEQKFGPIAKAVITVPAYFDETRRRATMDAGRLAGLEVLDIINEPTAAAIAFGYETGYLDSEGTLERDRPLRILVYDLGGGTFDVTIVEMSGQSFKALATDGDVRLGGKDWDEKLIDIMAEAYRLAHCADPRASAETMQALWNTAETIKRTLSERSKAMAIITHESTRFKMEVSRQQFEEATAPLVLRTRTTTEIVLLQAGLSWSDIDQVLLVGGSTRMPMIAKMILDLSGKQPERSVSVDEAVAHGAALYADMLLKRRGLGPGHTEFAVTNINSHSLGIAGLDPRSGRRVTTVLIPKNTALPHTARRRFRTAKAGQSSVRICVLEGESELPEACVEVGVATVRGLPANLPAGWPVEVSYSYGEGGRLQVSGALVGHDAGVTVEFARDNSLSDDDLLLWAECLNAEAARHAAVAGQANAASALRPYDSPGSKQDLPLHAAPRRAGAAGPNEKNLRVLRGDKIYGPMSREHVAQLVTSGRLTTGDLVCAIDGPWMPLADFLSPAPPAGTYPGAQPARAPAPTGVPPQLPGRPAAPAALPPRAAPESDVIELTLADLSDSPTPSAAHAGGPMMQNPTPLFDESVLDELEAERSAALSTVPEWFVKIRGMTSCHLSKAQLKSLVIAREIHPESPMAHCSWQNGTWRPFRAVHELADLWEFLPS